MATHPVVEISHATLDALASRGDVVQALPYLFESLVQAKATLAAACGRCGGAARARTALNAAYARVNSALLAISPEHKALLKAFLDADALRVSTGTDRNGLPVFHTV